MTITQVKEINEKIIELTDWIRRYRFEIRCVNLENSITSGKNIEWLDLTITNLEYTLQSIIGIYYYEAKHPDCATDLMRLARKRNDWISNTIDSRTEVDDDISLDELSLWIDLFALIYC